jgi:hypothetical protein
MLLRGTHSLTATARLLAILKMRIPDSNSMRKIIACGGMTLVPPSLRVSNHDLGALQAMIRLLRYWRRYFLRERVRSFHTATVMEAAIQLSKYLVASQIMLLRRGFVLIRQILWYHNSLSKLRRTDPLPVRFPSPGVGKRVCDFVQTENGFLPRASGSHVESSSSSFNNTSLSFIENIKLSLLPRIMIQAPSPKKAAVSRKRPSSASLQDTVGSPLSQRTRRVGNTGLPILPADAEALWKFKFPGNTHALLTILLTWSHAMWAFHHQLPDPKLFAIHPAFPHPISAPLRRQLISASFYDISIEPHKEMWYLGPGDVAEMSYHEVDVFASEDSNVQEYEASQPSFPIGVIKQTLGLTKTENPNHTRYMSMAQRAKTGEGRWCYILTKGHKTQNGGTPPHLILAWHASAVTRSSNCLHTIYPDDTTPNPLVQPQSKLRRFSSLENFSTAPRNPTRFNLHQMLRAVSSSSELPPVDIDPEIEKRGGTTLHRTVLKMEKAGSIPLIEGFRVDVTNFRGWLDACGKGRGKVFIWSEP